MLRGPRRYLLALVWIAAAVAVAAPASLAIVSTPADAQLFKRRTDEQGQPRERRGFFQRLFGSNDREPAAEPAERSRPAARRQGGGRAATGGGATADAAPARRQEPAAVEKLENARVVLVVGDFLASGLGEGLVEAFSSAPGVRVVTRANGSSGFVRDDHFDWPGQISGIVAEEKPAAVVVMIGSNDRQQLLVDGVRERPLSDPWKQAYASRARAMAQTIRQAGVPLLWMGAPSFSAGAMSTDMIALNDIYRNVAGEVGGEFIDIWDGFVDENGAFMPVGPDMNGQRVRLRGSDGINMTAAGKRKLAFYAERPLSRLLSAATAPFVAPAILDGAPVAPPPLDPREIDRTAPIALADPQLDGGMQLLGASSRQQPAEPIVMPVERMTRDGIAPAARTGRADDFMTHRIAAPAETAAPAELSEVSGPQPLNTSLETTGTIAN